jgi:hypothetical protein
MNTWVLAKLIGIACLGLGLFALWASPVSTVSCSRHDADVACRVDRALLGVVPLEGVSIAHIVGADVDRGTAGPDPSRRSTRAQPNNTYQLVFATRDGRVAPRGVDASHSGDLQLIEQEVNALVKGEGEPFTERSFNGFPNVAGAIFLLFGVLMLLTAG